MDDFLQMESICRAVTDYCFELLTSSVRQVHFVQVGAHDGVTADPLHSVILKHNWAGVRVEPAPSMFSKLQENSKAMPYVKVMQVACARDATPRPFYTLRPGPDGFYSFLSSFNKDIIMNHRHLVPTHKSRIEEYLVETLTVDQVMLRSEMPGIDLLLVDAEGYDDEVVLSLNFDRHRPRLINFEHKHLHQRSYRNLDYFLKSLGYTPMRLNTDSMYVSDLFLGAGRLRDFTSAFKSLF